jgi:hypothetical protein
MLTEEPRQEQWTFGDNCWNMNLQVMNSYETSSLGMKAEYIISSLKTRNIQ